MARPRGSRVGQVAAALGVLSFWVGVSVATALEPSHDSCVQYISELFATGSLLGPVWGYAILAPFGLCVVVASHSLLLHQDWRARLAGVSIAIFGLCVVALAVFPCDMGCRNPPTTWSDVIHKNVAEASIGFAALAPSWCFIAASLGRAYRTLSAVAVVLMFALVVCREMEVVQVGVLERLFLASVSVWIVGTTVLMSNADRTPSH